MSSHLNWQNLRSWNGSQHSAFEELCCQLASYESVERGSQFIRKGTPDAGVECFWTLPNGDELGWQTKFFASIDDSQWKQLDDSVKTVLKKHPQLIRYTICLPLDRPDARIEGQNSLLDKWNDRVKKWKKWANDQGRNIEFIYWGEHEIFERLTREEHRGRLYFWFNSEFFSDEWFQSRLKEAIANAGARYTPRYIPEINIELPIARLFDGLGRTKAFFNRFKVIKGKLEKSLPTPQPLKEEEVFPFWTLAFFRETESLGRLLLWVTLLQKWEISKHKKQAKNLLEKLTKNLHQILTLLNQLDSDYFNSLDKIQTSLIPLASDNSKRLKNHNLNLDLSKIDFSKLAQLASESKDLAYDYDRVLRNLEDEYKKAKKQPTNELTRHVNYYDIYGSQLHKLRELISELSSLNMLAESQEANLANVPALLLLGQAGTGKTHLLCDIAKNRLKSGLPTVILLGEQFNNSEPWSQIISLLKLSCTQEEFLGTLETVGQAKQCKVLIFIDALNEGEDKKFWEKHLAGMLTTLSHFPHLGIAISVRTPYEDVVIPKHLTSKQLIREHHEGFAGHEYQATKTFFDYYKIKRPSVPLLNPEFQNPLFLKLFCEGLKNEKLTEVPSGYYGITYIFKFLIDSVNEKLAREEYLNFDKQSRIVQKAMNKLAGLMAKGNKQWLTREEAQNEVNTFLPREGYHNSLFRHLLVEGLLTEDRFYQGNQEWIEGIRFSYERFSDHLIVKHLLDKHLDSNNPSESFLPEHPLGDLIKVGSNYYQIHGLIEALSIQLPERINQELGEVAPYCANSHIVIHSFIESLIWRNPTSITQTTLQYIKKYVIQDEDLYHQLLDAFLTVSTKPEHPYNADFLHRNLKQFNMAERDAEWSIFLHYQKGEHGAVARLVEWAWSQDDKSHINDESIRLCAIALTWFLTTSNRFLRDQSTKALVSILTPRIYLLNQLIPQFLDVNDLYVLERLFAVAYGCAMRSNNHQAIAELAQNVYHWIFEKGEPIPHILLRDYARGVIEVALHRQIDLEIDVNKIKPPYKSEWLSYIPSEEEIQDQITKVRQKHKNEAQEELPEFNRGNGLGSIEFSLSSGGDFARYIIGTNHGDFLWSSRR